MSTIDDFARVWIATDLTELYLKDGQYEDILRIYENVSRLTGYEADGYARIGLSYWKKQKLEQAVAAYRKAHSYDPDDFDAVFGYGAVNEILQRFPEAAEVYTKLLAVYTHRRLSKRQTGPLVHANEFLLRTRLIPQSQSYGKAVHQGGQGPQRD